MTQGNSAFLSSQCQTVKQRSRWLLKQSIQTNHNRIVTCGCLVLLVYLPAWCGIIGHKFATGASTPLLNLGFLYLGLDSLWRQRQQLVAVASNESDRTVGYLLILGAAAFFPFCLSSVSLQSLVCMIIVVGMTLCCWGVEFFPQHIRSVILLLIGTYPDLGFLANILRGLLTGNQLEHLMAWSGGLALKAIGQPITVDGSIISLSMTIETGKAVEVGAGCSGFDMAFVLAGVGIIMGLFFNRSCLTVTVLAISGVTLALLFNVPRIMLLAFAVVYWGKGAFEFWHGPIGGQIFSTLLLTAYYYAAMGIINRKASKRAG